MEGWIRLVGPDRAVEFLGVLLVGVNAENGKKLLLTLLFIALALLLGWVLRRLASWLLQSRGYDRAEFWTRQAIKQVGWISAASSTIIRAIIVNDFGGWRFTYPPYCIS